jgi:integrase
VWQPALKAVDLPATMVPYDMSHTFASLLLHEGRLSLAEIAAQFGHSVMVLMSTYAHVIADLKGVERTSAEEAIQAARAEVSGAPAARKRPTGEAGAR